MSRDQPPPLPGGLEFDRIMRGLMNDTDGADDAPPDPWQSPAAFVEWLKASAFPGPNNGISRYLRAVYLSRPDLSRAFPEVPGNDMAEFYRWARQHGVTEIPIPAPLLPPEQWRAKRRRTRRPRRPGVNLVGFLDDVLGIGEVARRLGDALDAVGVPVARVRASCTPNAALTHPNDVNIVCINPDSLARFVRDNEQLVERRYTIGVWFWETEELPPSFGWAFDYVDEVWAASEFVRVALARRAPERVPVTRVAVPVVRPEIDPKFERRSLGVPDDRVVFLTSFDYLSVVDRKNPGGAIAAYCQAFAREDAAMLVVKSINGDRRPDDRARVQRAAAGRDDVLFVDERLAPATNAALVAQCDCLVSLHRSEGFGLNMADALALGRPVIATAYGANLDYMAELDEWLVPFSLIDVGEGQHPYPSDHRWADPDVSAAAALMQRIAAEPESARQRATQHGQHLAEEFSLENVGRSLADRIGGLRGRLPAMLRPNKG